jgi:valyl-tRNA synthetase
MSESTLNKAYEPNDVEKRIYAFWEEQGLFRAQEKSDKPSYSIVIPPPNVTGVLHMGHALNNTLQDILCRYKKLTGHNVLWMPGTDHAGIATQNVVERKLAQEGTNRHELGRDAFIERVWEWRKQYGGAIINQLKRLGASCDWERERFTMDAGLSDAVRAVFVKLYDQGLIYRGDYIINWCPRCRTALADLEVEHEDTEGNLYAIRYPAADGGPGLVVATTRPETMLGDTAVAVNPKDERYEGQIGKNLVLPLMNREIPVIADPYVDKEFGTGALKVTPAHDPNDFELGLRHKLAAPKVIGDDGLMTGDAGKYAGLDRFAARKAIVEDLKQLGLLEKITPHNHAVGHCYRCKDTVEPNLSKQWFVKVKPLAEKAVAAVESGQTKIVPESWAKTYFEWMNNIRDWCISRQIWWGHRIPAWLCQDCSQMIVAIDDPTACTACGSKKLAQETDVLDTWFSSALWPFSTMGWPNNTELLKTFYPTSVLVTAFDILFFWVARMMMMGIHFMDEVPFKDVYIHALVRDEHGKKMSKSTGNVIDPLEVIDKLGCDAFRFTLAAFAAQGRDIKLSMERIEGYRHFINKLWNAARFSLPLLEGFDPARQAPKSDFLPDRWIKARLAQTALSVAKDIETYRFNEAASALYQFTWREFCDWYLEAIKPVLYSDGNADPAPTQAVLYKVLSDTLIMLHPFVPFVTEEIYQKLPGAKSSIMLESFPSGAVDDALAIEQMNLVMEIITAVRNIRSEMNIAPKQALTVLISLPDEAARERVAPHQDIICNLAKIEKLDIQAAAPRPKGAATALVADLKVFVLLEGVIDLNQEIARLDNQISKLDKELEKLNAKINNKAFMDKAPQDIVEKVSAQQGELSEKRTGLLATQERIREIAGS